MKAEDILALVKAGYTKDEIAALEAPAAGQSGSPETPAGEPASEAPNKQTPAQPEQTIDYAKLSMELMKAVAGKDTGSSPNHKTKQEQVDEAMLAFVK